jgi:hypothetical protein
VSIRYQRRKALATSLDAPPRSREVCLQLTDHSSVKHSAIDFFDLRKQRDPHSQAARLTHQFVTQNRQLMNLLDVSIDPEYDGDDVRLRIQSGSGVGAIPLFSPTTSRLDYGLVVQPRFPWAGIGPMLADMGWKISPTPLKLPLLRKSERKVPAWVLSFMILVRLKALLDSIDRRFELISETRQAPRGKVNWTEYATRNITRAGFLSLPCTFPDLRDDQLLKGAIRHTAERQLQSLEAQKEQGAFVHKLIDLAMQLLTRVGPVRSYIPSSLMLGNWAQRPMRTETFTDGLQAIEWTVDERGLAGMSDLEGIPWKMPMEQFFEAWVETTFRIVAQNTGGQVRVGRKRETVHPIQWDPVYTGSQKSLVPDIWLEWASATLIVDAKYKRHWEELQQLSWARVEEAIREDHRNDLLQILAYANLARTRSVIVCLAYPCSQQSWNSLQERSRLVHHAEFSVGERSIQLWLTAIPMATAVSRIAAPLTEQLRRVLK